VTLRLRKAGGIDLGHRPVHPDLPIRHRGGKITNQLQVQALIEHPHVPGNGTVTGEPGRRRREPVVLRFHPAGEEERIGPPLPDDGPVPRQPVVLPIEVDLVRERKGVWRVGEAARVLKMPLAVYVVVQPQDVHAARVQCQEPFSTDAVQELTQRPVRVVAIAQ
jgi:hypothetical protein